MRILYIVPNPPSLVRVRPYNLIRFLIQRGHQVTVATIWRGEEEYNDLRHLEELGVEVIAAPQTLGRIAANVGRALLRGLPAQATYTENPQLQRAILQRVYAGGEDPTANFDIIHTEHLRGARYGLWLKARWPHKTSTPPPPFIWDSVDCISHLFAQAATTSDSLRGRWMARLELGRTRRYEGKLVEQFDKVLVTSPVDKQALERLARPGAAPAPISVLPNGVDLDYFSADETPRDSATILFSGKMSYHANVTAALHLIHDIMPAVWRALPHAQVVLAGKDPPPLLRRLGQEMARVTVTGTVPDLRPYLRRATVSVAPLRYGAGIQNKVLEAMACGAPVIVSTSAASGLPSASGEHILVAKDATDFAEQIIRALTDEELRCRLSLAGRQYVQRYHDWRSVVQMLENIYLSCLGTTSSASMPSGQSRSVASLGFTRSPETN